MDRKQRRELRDAQRRAEQRRAAWESAQHESPPGSVGPVYGPLPATPKPWASVGPAPMAARDVSGLAAAQFFACALVAALCVVLSVTTTTPLLTGNWDYRGLGFLLLAGAATAGAVQAWPAASGKSRFVTAFTVFLMVVSSGAGLVAPVVVDGRLQLHGSTAYRAERMAFDMLADMRVVEENQALLNLPAEQARGVASLFEAAAQQDASIAARWNPAIIGEVPLPGFVEVARLLNQAADLQASALLAARSNLEQFDPQREQQVLQSGQRVIELLTGPQGAAAALGRTVAPLGIELVEKKVAT